MKTILVVLASLFVVSCALFPDDDQVRVSFVVQRPPEFGEEEFLKPFRSPSSLSSFKCIGLNIVGGGISSAAPLKFPANPAVLDNGSYCTYPGASSLVIPFDGTEREVKAFAPRGTARLLQVLAFESSDTTCANSSFPVAEIWRRKQDDPVSVAAFENYYEVGRKVVTFPSGVSNVMFDIASEFNTSALKPVSTCPPSGSSSSSLNFAMTTSPGIARTATRQLSAYTTGGTSPYTYTKVGGLSNATVSSGTLSLGTVTASPSFVVVSVTDNDGNTLNSGSITVKDFEIEAVGGANRAFWGTADEFNGDPASGDTWTNLFSQIPFSLDATASLTFSAIAGPKSNAALTANSGYFHASPSLGTLTEFVAFAVIRFGGTPGKALCFSAGGGCVSSHYILLDWDGTNFVAKLNNLGGSKTISRVGDSSNFHIHMMRYTGARFQYSVDGVLVDDQAYSGSVVLGSTTDFSVGGSQGTASQAQIAELMFFTSSLSASELVNIRDYFQKKYL